MAKKRKKKSKGRRKRQKKKASPEEVTPAVDTVVEAEAEADGTAEDAEVDAPVDAVIDLEDDLDDPLARADLVAAAAGLEAPARAEGDAEGPGDADRDDPPEEPADPDDEAADAQAAAAAAEPPSDIEGAGEQDSDAEYGVAADAEESRGPLIGPDALVALSEFRREGVATLPEELILDLGESATPEERDRVLAAALAHVEMQDAIYRVPLESGASRRWKGLLATAVFLMALVLVGLPPAFLVPRAPPPLTVSETAEGTRLALLMQAEQIEAFRVRSGRLPMSIDEVDTALPGVRFVRSSNRLYQLIAYTPSGEAVVYDSASPDPSFAATAEVWARVRGDS